MHQAAFLCNLQVRRYHRHDAPPQQRLWLAQGDSGSHAPHPQVTLPSLAARRLQGELSWAGAGGRQGRVYGSKTSAQDREACLQFAFHNPLQSSYAWQHDPPSSTGLTCELTTSLWQYPAQTQPREHHAMQVMFSRPMPELSCKLNAWATWLTCQWLMGPCEINDVEVDGGQMGVGQGVLVKR